MKPKSDEAWLTTTEVAAILNVHRNTVARWCVAKSIPRRELPSGHFRIQKHVADELAKQMESADDGKGDSESGHTGSGHASRDGSANVG